MKVSDLSKEHDSMSQACSDTSLFGEEKAYLSREPSVCTKVTRLHFSTLPDHAQIHYSSMCSKYFVNIFHIGITHKDYIICLW